LSIVEHEVVALTGNEAAAEAMRQINPDVVAAYPITPQTEIMQVFSSYVADGAVDTELIAVESEHSAMSACIGAAAAGARVMTATSSQGLALMWEMLYIAASLRLPIVMVDVNRALSGNINIHCDHSDTMGARDSGWIQIYSENAQEIYHNIIQAVPIAEGIFLPTMVMMDGFITSHAIEPVKLMPDGDVKEFVGERRSPYSLLDYRNPITVGPLDLPDYYFEHKRMEAEAMRQAKGVILDVARRFEKKFEVKYDLLEGYMLEDAEVAVVCIGSACGTAREAVRILRDDGIKAGLLKIRVFRPFPFIEIADALKDKAAVAVMDRAEGMSGWGGPLFAEVRSALFDLERRPKVVNYIYGLGGRDVKVDQFVSVFHELVELAEGKPVELVNYLGVRE
jgi:pyruvate ferredoxin oxidoreductase alpha subunit